MLRRNLFGSDSGRRDDLRPGVLKSEPDLMAVVAVQADLDLFHVGFLIVTRCMKN